MLYHPDLFCNCQRWTSTQKYKLQPYKWHELHTHSASLHLTFWPWAYHGNQWPLQISFLLLHVTPDGISRHMKCYSHLRSQDKQVRQARQAIMYLWTDNRPHRHPSSHLNNHLMSYMTVQITNHFTRLKLYRAGEKRTSSLSRHIARFTHFFLWQIDLLLHVAVTEALIT